MSLYDELIRALSPNNRELRALLEALQTNLAAAQTIVDLNFGPHFDDLRVPFTQTRRGANLKPDFDETNVGYLFPQNDATEKLYFVAQIPHSWKIGTPLRPHLHWRQNAATAVTWKLDIEVVIRELNMPEFTTLSAPTGVFTYTSGAISQINRFPDIDMSGVTATSGMLIGRIYRDDNTTTGDVLAWELDFHFQSDTPGTLSEFTK